MGEKESSDYLEGVKTLGFRGQAVNSIAKLCKQMTIHTVFNEKNNYSNNNHNSRLK
jgi:DNA mismatch repair ATPase MutL